MLPLHHEAMIGSSTCVPAAAPKAFGVQRAPRADQFGTANTREVNSLFGEFSMCRKRIFDVHRQNKLLEEDLVIVNGRTDKAGRLVCAIVERVQCVDWNDQSIARSTAYPLLPALLVTPCFHRRHH